MTDSRTYKDHLQILQPQEIKELYTIPEFNREERITFLTLSPEEYELMRSLRGISSRTFFILQLGYFKAKHLFFVFDFESRAADTAFILKKYFPENTGKDLQMITKPTRLYQRRLICQILRYRFFEPALLESIIERAALFAKRYNHPVYLFRCLFRYFHNRKIILPAYSFLQRDIISPTIRSEHTRLERIIERHVSTSEKELLDALLVKPEEGKYPFTQLQKEPSSLQYYQIRGQLKNALQLQPLYKIASRLHRLMDISNENMRYYGTIAEDYKPLNLRQLKGNMRYIYLLCFAYNRYRFINDILIEGLKFHLLGLEQSAKEFAKTEIYRHQLQAHTSLSKVPRILALLKDESLDELLFKAVKEVAFSILNQKEMDLVSDLIRQNKPDKKQLMNRFYQNNKRLISLYLRPSVIHFEFDNAAKCQDIIEAISFINCRIELKKSLRKIPKEAFPDAFLSKKQKRYLTGKNSLWDVAKYEMSLYQALRNKIEAGDIFVSDSFKNRSFEQDLIEVKEWKTNKQNIINEVDLPKLRKSASEILTQWEALIEPLYKRVNDRIKNGLNPSVQIDGKHKDGSTKWHLNYTETSKSLNHRIYEQFAPIDVASMLQLVDEHTDFLNAFTHLLGYHEHSCKNLR